MSDEVVEIDTEVDIENLEITDDNFDSQSEHDSVVYDDYLSDEEMNNNYTFFKKKPSNKTNQYKEQFRKDKNVLNINNNVKKDELKEEIYLSD